MSRPRDPEGRRQWQDAVNGAHLLLVLDSLRQYGLIEGGPVGNLPRARSLVERAARRRVYPQSAVVDELLGQLARLTPEGLRRAGEVQKEMSRERQARRKRAADVTARDADGRPLAPGDEVEWASVPKLSGRTSRYGTVDRLGTQGGTVLVRRDGTQKAVLFDSSYWRWRDPETPKEPEHERRTRERRAFGDLSPGDRVVMTAEAVRAGRHYKPGGHSGSVFGEFIRAAADAEGRPSGIYVRRDGNATPRLYAPNEWRKLRDGERVDVAELLKNAPPYPGRTAQRRSDGAFTGQETAPEPPEGRKEGDGGGGAGRPDAETSLLRPVSASGGHSTGTPAPPAAPPYNPPEVVGTSAWASGPADGDPARLADYIAEGHRREGEGYELVVSARTAEFIREAEGREGVSAEALASGMAGAPVRLKVYEPPPDVAMAAEAEPADPSAAGWGLLSGVPEGLDPRMQVWATAPGGRSFEVTRRKCELRDVPSGWRWERAEDDDDEG